jgi:hypothetical protein
LKQEPQTVTDSKPDSDRMIRSFRSVVREELEPVKLAHRDTANAVIELGRDVQKLDGSINGNGQPGLRDRVTILETEAKKRSLPPPRVPQPSIADLVIEQAKTSTERWKTAGRIVALIIAGAAAGGMGHWGVSQAAEKTTLPAP